MVELRRTGLRPTEIALELGVAVATVQKHLRLSRVPPSESWASNPARKKRLRERTRRAAEALRLFDSGLTLLEIADRLGISKSTAGYDVRIERARLGVRSKGAGGRRSTPASGTKR